jgi:two-component system sensor histidine kinase KdpD
LKENLGTKIIQVSIKENLPLFKLDVGLMEQVLHNLIYNATLYIAANGEIKITADFINDKLILVIEDNGEGFPADEIEKVFEKFYRLKNAKPGGTGLGLSIVKGFVEAHNGTIQLENKASGGAKFTITIPTEISFLNNLKND